MTKTEEAQAVTFCLLLVFDTFLQDGQSRHQRQVGRCRRHLNSKICLELQFSERQANAHPVLIEITVFTAIQGTYGATVRRLK